MILQALPKVLLCAVLAFTLGLAAWLAWPTGRSFSYLSDPRTALRLELPLTRDMLTDPSKRPRSSVPVGERVRELQALIGGEGQVYSTLSVETSVPLVWQGKTLRGLELVKVLGDYLKGRDLSLRAGRLPGVNRPEVALNETLASQLTPDVKALLGQEVVLNPQVGGERVTITGIVRSSPWRSEQDPDVGGFRFLDPSLPGLDPEVMTTLSFTPPGFNVVFDAPPSPTVRQRLERFTAQRLPGFRLVNLSTLFQADPTLKGIRARLQERTLALPLLASLLGLSGLCALGALLLSSLLRRRALLGVDLTLGAPRGRLLLEVLSGQLLPAALGGLLGTALLYALPKVLSGVLVGAPPNGVLLLALGVPLLTLTLLTLLVAGRVLSAPPLELLRGARPGEFVRPLLMVMLTAFTLAASALLSALGVREKLEGQTSRVRQEFGRLLEWTTSSGVDTRKGEGSVFSSRSLSASDLRWLEQQPEVRSATVAERLNPDFEVGGQTVQIERPLTGDGLVKTLNLRVKSGTTGGCLLSEAQAQRLKLAVGSTLGIPAPGGVLPCRVTGLFETPDALTAFVLTDFPGMVVPSALGLVGKQRDALGQVAKRDPEAPNELRTTALLLRLRGDATPETLLAFKKRIVTYRPDLEFTFRPYAPSIASLLAALERQSQLFVALAALGTLMTLLGLLGGFLAYLDASRYRLALERSQGLTLHSLRWGWALSGVWLGSLGSLLALGVATPLSASLYNAFSLDAPVTMALDLLPRANPALPGAWTLGVAALLVVALTGGMVLLGLRWLRQQSLMTLLKVGS